MILRRRDTQWQYEFTSSCMALAPVLPVCFLADWAWLVTWKWQLYSDCAPLTVALILAAFAHCCKLKDIAT